MGRVALILFVCAALAGTVRAETRIDVEYGWGGRYRAGTWTPIFVTLADPRPRGALIELMTPADSGAAMKIHQTVAIGPDPATYPLYAPISYNLSETVLTVRDLETKKRLTAFRFDDPDSPNWQPAYQFTADGQTLIGVSGRAATMQLLERQVNNTSGERAISIGYLRPERLPAVAEGYTSLDLLALNQPNLDMTVGLRFEQQEAIVNWVRAGGNLVFWPGEDPIPATSPIAMALPARIGDAQALNASAETLDDYGLPRRFAQLKSRRVDPVNDAETFNLLGDSAAVGVRKRIGFGRIIVLSIDASQLQFDDPDSAKKFWDPILAGMVEPDDPVAATRPYRHQNTIEQRHAAAITSTMDLLGNIPGVGSFGFSYVVIVLVALMLVVGPIDWFILKKLGKQPWTWVTTAGWIALVSGGAIYTGHMFKSGDLHLRTLRLIDQADGQSVAAVDFVGIYSPRTQGYELTVDESGWFRTPDMGRYNYMGRLRNEVPFHQDYEGNHPLKMLINVWNLQFIEGQTMTSGPPVIEAKLRVNPDDTLSGAIINLSEDAMKNISVQTTEGLYNLKETCGPGQTVNIDRATITRPAEIPTDEHLRYYNTTLESRHFFRGINYLQLGLLSPMRSLAAERALKDAGGSIACVYAEIENAAPVATVAPAGAIEQHRRIVRALVKLTDQPSVEAAP